MGQIKVQYDLDGIEGLCVIDLAVHGDARGYFMETYNANDMKEAGLDILFVQDNQSCSTKGVLRGLHFQKQFPQTKLVRVIRGSVFDVAVDLRPGSATYGNRTAGKREFCLIPFYSFVAARSSLERYRSLVANILLFIPFGLTLPFGLKRDPIRTTFLAAAGLSVMIELIQFAFGLGLCEVDDVIFNTLGAAFGTLAFACLRGRKNDCD